MQHGALHWFEPRELDPERRRTYEAITAGPRAVSARELCLVDDAGRLEGPFNAMLFSPGLGLAVQAVGSALRFGTTLSARLRELAVLTVAVSLRCDYEWFVHERLARAAGFTDEELETMSSGGEPVSFSSDERLARAVVLDLANAHDLAEETLERARAVFGDVALVELVNLVGYYQLLALGMRVFRTPLPGGVASPFA